LNQARPSSFVTLSALDLMVLATGIEGAVVVRVKA
jgi:hypothetical protein